MGLTLEQIENVVIDAGVVYVNYGVAGERQLAPCRGGNTFNVDAEIREIEFDGARGKTKGMRRKIREDASLIVRLADMSLENLHMALPGSVLVGKKLTNGWGIDADNYLTNVTLIGQDMKDDFKVITIYNGLMDEAFEAVYTDKEESIIELKISGHYDPADTSNKLWSIEDVVADDVTVTKANILGVSIPETGETPSNYIIPSTQYTGSIAWTPPIATVFETTTDYTATITLQPKAGFKFNGVTSDFYTVAGGTATNTINSGVITVEFPTTA